MFYFGYSGNILQLNVLFVVCILFQGTLFKFVISMNDTSSLNSGLPYSKILIARFGCMVKTTV